MKTNDLFHLCKSFCPKVFAKHWNYRWKFSDIIEAVWIQREKRRNARNAANKSLHFTKLNGNVIFVSRSHSNAVSCYTHSIYEHGNNLIRIPPNRILIKFLHWDKDRDEISMFDILCSLFRETDFRWGFWNSFRSRLMDRCCFEALRSPEVNTAFGGPYALKTFI